MTRTAALLAAALLAAPTLAGPKDAAPATAPDITKYVEDYALPELWIGSKAPELTIAEFIKGAPVTSFEPGRVYVVEFWATWCGPCIKAFPHLTELQEHYGDKVAIIGVNIWERAEGDERLAMVREFVEEQGERMGYTVAIEDGTSMAESWMQAAGRNGIPSAFIVDKNGAIAWMGHPATMDEPLEKIVKGDYDPAQAKKEAAESHRTSAWMRYLMPKLAEEPDATLPLVRDLVRTEFHDNEGVLNFFAWNMLTNESMPESSLPVAMEAAQRAAELTDHNEPMILDTLAYAHFKSGDAAKALEIQTKAISLLGEGDDASEYQERLAQYRQAVNKG